jgi:hypothetical protein
MRDTLMQRNAVTQYYVLRIYFTAFRPGLGPTQPPIQNVSGTLHWG